MRHSKFMDRFSVVVFTCVLSFLAFSPKAHSQGCMTLTDHGLSLNAQGGGYLERGEWLVGLSYRWGSADRVFVGNKEIDASGGWDTREIHFLDLNVDYMATKRLSLSVKFPFKYGEETDAIYHDFKNFHTMSAGGLGDIRLVGRVWLLDPAKQLEKQQSQQNISLGLGIQLPTGDYKATDVSYRETGPVTRPVHPALQPGTGGWGIVLEMEAFKEVFKNAIAYVSGLYLISPRELNDVQITYADRPIAAAVEDGILQSVPDSYVGRAGLSYAICPSQGLSISLGGRIEGMPTRDVIGGSEGYRPAGFAIAIEPGLTWTRGRNIFNVSVPVAIERHRERNVPNLRSGTAYPAAFADFVILAGYSRRFR